MYCKARMFEKNICIKHEIIKYDHIKKSTDSAVILSLWIFSFPILCLKIPDCIFQHNLCNRHFQVPLDQAYEAYKWLASLKLYLLSSLQAGKKKHLIFRLGKVTTFKKQQSSTFFSIMICIIWRPDWPSGFRIAFSNLKNTSNLI